MLHSINLVSKLTMRPIHQSRAFPFWQDVLSFNQSGAMSILAFETY